MTDMMIRRNVARRLTQMVMKECGYLYRRGTMAGVEEMNLGFRRAETKPLKTGPDEIIVTFRLADLSSWRWGVPFLRHVIDTVSETIKEHELDLSQHPYQI